MKESMVRLSFDIPKSEHFTLKTECVKAKLSIKDFVYQIILKGLQDLKNESFKKRLMESIQQSKERKCRAISSEELDEIFNDSD